MSWPAAALKAILFLAVRAYATSLLQSRSFDHPGQKT